MVCGNTSQHNNTTHHFRFSLPTLPLPPDAPSPCSPLHPLSLSLYPRLNINEKYEGKRLVLRQPGIQGGREGGEGRGDLSACLDILEVVDAFLLLRGMGNVPGIARLHLGKRKKGEERGGVQCVFCGSTPWNRRRGTLSPPLPPSLPPLPDS